MGQAAILLAMAFGVHLFLLFFSGHSTGAVLVTECSLCVGEPVRASSATPSDWVALPGIGPKTAEKIRDHTDRFGPIRSRADLLQVRGVGIKTIDRVEPFLDFETGVDK